MGGGESVRLKQQFRTPNAWVRSCGQIRGRRGQWSSCCVCSSAMQSISHDVLESHLTVYALGEGKLWCFRGDSALPLENSRKSQVCPCRQPSLCHGCVFIGQGLESLALSLRLTCPNVSHLLGARGVGGRMSLQPPPSGSHTVLGLRRSLLCVEWPPSPVFLPPIERRLKLSDIKIQLALLGEVRGRSPPESARVSPVAADGESEKPGFAFQLDTMNGMTLGKSPNLPEIWFYCLKNGSNMTCPAYLTRLMTGSKNDDQTQTQPLH